jgi:glutathione synthase/RimK-type ligase-like ATP-grasp enzyme
LKSEIAKLEMQLNRNNKELEKQAKLKAAQSAPSSVKEAQLQSEVDKCMVRKLAMFRFDHRLIEYAEHTEMFNLQVEHEEYRDYKMHALCVLSSFRTI